MTTALAEILRAQLATALPFLDRVVGLARLDTSAIVDGDSTRIVKLPVPITFTAADCERDKRYLVPDRNTVAILFFEDGGAQPLVNAQSPANLGIRQASLRLLLWLNPQRLSDPLSETQLLVLIEKALQVNKPRWSAGDFTDISITYTTLPAETSLYGRYTFDTETPLLLPPYQLLGLDLRIQFRVNSKCLPIILPTAVDAPIC